MDATGISARLKDSGPGRQKNRGQKNEAESRRFIQLIQRRGCSAIQQTDGEHLHGLCAKNLLARRAGEKQKDNISDSGLSINMPPLTGVGRADQLANGVRSNVSGVGFIRQQLIQPLQVEDCMTRTPRVARSSQPWAE